MREAQLRASQMAIRVDAPKAPKPQAPKAEERVTESARLTRVDAVSVKIEPTEAAAPQPTLEQTQPPLTQEGLEAVWKEMLEAMHEELPKLYDLLEGKEVQMVGEDDFVVLVSNTYVENEAKAHMVRMLTYLRKRSGRPMLNCSMKVVVQERETRPYSARDKYDAMVLVNPELEVMRILFPNVEM